MKFERKYFIHYYDIDLNKNASITSLMKFFEDIAILQSEHVGLGLKYYEEKKSGWLLYKWDIKINKMPVLLEEVLVITEPKSISKFYAFRSFEIKNEAGETLVTANTLWFYIDILSRRPAKIPDEMYTGYGVERKQGGELAIADPERSDEIDFEKEFNIRHSDIDTNEHVNNIKYVEWALEVVPVEILNNYLLKRIKIVYKKETNYGRKINSLVHICNENSIVVCKHKILDDTTELCLLETHWEEMDIRS